MESFLIVLVSEPFGLVPDFMNFSTPTIIITPVGIFVLELFLASFVATYHPPPPPPTPQLPSFFQKQFHFFALPLLSNCPSTIFSDQWRLILVPQFCPIFFN